jgi:hypothetical protein
LLLLLDTQEGEAVEQVLWGEMEPLLPLLAAMAAQARHQHYLEVL